MSSRKLIGSTIGWTSSIFPFKFNFPLEEIILNYLNYRKVSSTNLTFFGVNYISDKSDMTKHTFRQFCHHEFRSYLMGHFKKFTHVQKYFIESENQ